MDNVSMGLPLGPTIANVFLWFYKVKWFEQFPESDLNQCFTEDRLMIFFFSSNSNWLDAYRNFVINLILAIKTCLFTLNNKNNGKLSLLYVEVFWEKG